VKKIIIITGFPGVGKTTVGKGVAKSINASLLDKDTVSDKFTNLITKYVTKENDKESLFYKTVIRDLEYTVTMDIALEQIEFLDCIVIVGPFTKELKKESVFFETYIKKTKDKNINVNFYFFNIICDQDENKIRIENRGLPEDKIKILDWDKYKDKRSNNNTKEGVIVLENKNVEKTISDVLSFLK
jgi:2-phosphoglycerate kinase